MSEHGEVLPPEPSPAAAEVAFAADQRIRAKVRQMRGLWVEIAAELYEFHRQQLWRGLGHDSFDAWISDPEFEGDLGRRWAYDLIAVHTQLVVDRGVDPSRLQRLHVSKVREVLPAIRRGQVQLEDALGDAETLSRPDLEIRYRGVASSSPVAGPDGTTAVDTRAEPEWVVCGCCGSRYLRRAAQ